MSDLARDFLHAWRRLRATPLFTIFAIGSLAVGVGVTTAVFSVVNTLFFKGPGIPEPDRVAVVVGSSVYSGGRYSWQGIISKADFDDIAAGITSFDRLAASLTFHQALVTPERADTIQGEAVTGEYFHTIGVRAARGRTLDRSDDEQQRAVVVLSHAYWKTRFNANPDVAGAVVRIGGHQFEVVGVASESFEGVSLVLPRPTSVWVPLSSANLFPNVSSADSRSLRDRRRLTVVGRLAEGRGAAQAGAEVMALSHQLDIAHPITARRFDSTATSVKRNWSVRTVEAAHGEMAAALRGPGMLILMLVAMVLVVACTNLANLTVARGIARQHEQSVRRALGASRWRLIREQSAESAIVAVLGGLLASVIIRALFHLFNAEFPISRAVSVQLSPELNAAALAVAAACVLFSLAIFGIGPALELTRGSVRADLAQGGGTVGRANTPSQRRSIRWQVAIASSFFIVSTLTMKAVIAEARHDSGIDLDRISVAFIDFHLLRWDESRARRAVEKLLLELRRQADLESAAVSSGMPFGTVTTPFVDMSPAGTTFLKGARYPGGLALVSTPAIFKTLGVPILRGRAFDDRDGAAGRRVVVMNEIAAREVFGTTDVVGREIVFRMNALRSTNVAPVAATVIGVSADTDAQSLMRRNSGTVYIPFAQQYEPSLVVVGRAKTDTRKAAEALRAAIRAADPEVSVERAGTGFTMLAGFYFTARIAAIIAASLGLLTLILSMVGLHGVLAQMVTMRTREVGLRMALGAERRQIVRMVLGDGFRPVIEGLAFGILLGILGRVVIRATVMPTLSVLDPVVLAVLPIPILLAGFLACYAPARRAAEVDPNVALRAL